MKAWRDGDGSPADPGGAPADAGDAETLEELRRRGIDSTRRAVPLPARMPTTSPSPDTPIRTATPSRASRRSSGSSGPGRSPWAPRSIAPAGPSSPWPRGTRPVATGSACSCPGSGRSRGGARPGRGGADHPRGPRRRDPDPRRRAAPVRRAGPGPHLRGPGRRGPGAGAPPGRRSAPYPLSRSRIRSGRSRPSAARRSPSRAMTSWASLLATMADALGRRPRLAPGARPPTTPLRCSRPAASWPPGCHRRARPRRRPGRGRRPRGLRRADRADARQRPGPRDPGGAHRPDDPGRRRDAGPPPRRAGPPGTRRTALYRAAAEREIALAEAGPGAGGRRIDAAVACDAALTRYHDRRWSTASRPVRGPPGRPPRPRARTSAGISASRRARVQPGADAPDGALRPAVARRAHPPRPLDHRDPPRPALDRTPPPGLLAHLAAIADVASLERPRGAVARLRAALATSAGGIVSANRDRPPSSSACAVAGATPSPGRCRRARPIPARASRRRPCARSPRRPACRSDPGAHPEHRVRFVQTGRGSTRPCTTS